MKRYLLAISMALNQLFNALTGGDPDESVSSRAARARARGATVGTAVCRVLDWLDPHDGDSLRGDHCDIALENQRDEVKRQAERMKEQ